MTNQTIKSIQSTTFNPLNRFNDLLSFAMDYINTVTEFTTEKMRLAYSETYQTYPVEPRAWGAVILELRRKNKIKSSGITKSVNKKSHHRPIYIWKTI